MLITGPRARSRTTSAMAQTEVMKAGRTASSSCEFPMNRGSINGGGAQIEANAYWLGALGSRLVQLASFVPETRELAERELEAMQLAMCALRTRMNAFSPIGYLPPEILCKIFLFLSIDEPQRSTRLLGWIKVTHICRYWRQAALQEPDLWGNVTFDLGSRWAEEILTRAKASAVSITYNYEGALPSDDFVSSRLSHVVHLDLQGSEERLGPIISSLTWPAPALKFVRISTDGELILPEHVFGGNAPLLHHLALTNSCLTLSSASFKGLTRLDIVSTMDHLADSTPNHVASSHSLDLLIAVLATMPALEFLNVEDCLLHQPDAPSSLPRANLIHLRHLGLTGIAAECTRLMESLHLPIHCRFTLDFTNFSLGSYTLFLQVVRDHFSRESAADIHPFTALSTSPLSTQNGLGIKAWRCSTLCSKDGSFASLPTGDPDLQVQMTNLAADITTPIQDLCGVLPIDDLRILSKKVFNLVWSSQQWLSAFGRCKALEHALIAGDDTLHFTRALIFHTDLHNVAGSRQRRSGGRILRRGHIFLPNLKSLTLQDFSFDMRSSQGHTFLALLEKWLRARKCIDAAPRLLLEDARSFSRDEIARLRTLVEVVTDRGHEGDSEDEDEDGDGDEDEDSEDDSD